MIPLVLSEPPWDAQQNKCSKAFFQPKENMFYTFLKTSIFQTKKNICVRLKELIIQPTQKFLALTKKKTIFYPQRKNVLCFPEKNTHTCPKIKQFSKQK